MPNEHYRILRLLDFVLIELRVIELTDISMYEAETFAKRYVTEQEYD